MTATPVVPGVALPTPTSPKLTPGRLLALLILMCSALGLVLAANASLTVALPEIARDLGASQTDLTWVINGYAILFAALLLPAGIAADRFGRRPTLVWGLALFGLSSALSAYVDSPGWLILLRVLSGVGAAFVMPATLSVLTDAYPPERRAFAVSVWAAVSGAGVLLGLLAGGLLLTSFWWGSVLLIAGIAALPLIVACLALVPPYRNPDLHLDPPGAVCAVIALGSLTYALIEAPERGWTAWITLTSFAVGTVALVAFVTVELMVRRPMLDVRLFRYRGLSVGSGMVFLQFSAVLGLIIFIPQQLQSVGGLSPLEAAVRLLPVAIGMMPASQAAPALAARFGDRVIVTLGMAAAAGGFALIAALDQTGPYWLLALGLVIFGTGFGLSTTPATTMIIAGLPEDRRTLASAVNDAAREVGGAIGIAVLATVLNSVYRHHAEDFASALPPEAGRLSTEGVNSALVVANAIEDTAGEALATAARAAFHDGYQLALFTGSGILLAGAVLCAIFAPATGTAPGSGARLAPPSTTGRGSAVNQG